MKSLDFTGFLKKFFCTLFVGFLLRNNILKSQLMGTMLNSEGSVFPDQGRRGRFLIAVPVFKNCSRGTAKHRLRSMGGQSVKKRSEGNSERLGMRSERGERAINPKSAAADV